MAKKPPFLKFLSWSFLVAWEDSVWRTSWSVFSLLTAALLFGAAKNAVAADQQAALACATVAAGTAVMAWFAARLHHRSNDGSVLVHYNIRKKGPRS